MQLHRQPRPRRPHRTAAGIAAALLTAALAALACGPKGDRQLGQACGEDGDCDDGMFCDDEGSTAGQCTRECDPSPDPCPEFFVDEAFCNAAGVCVLGCEGDDVCPRGTRCINEVCDRG